MTILLTVLITLLVLYVLLLFGTAWLSLHPIRTPIFLSATSLGAPQENVEFANGDGQTLRGWWLEQPGAKTVVILAHGYVMNRAEMAPVAAPLWKEGCSCLLFEFRAHGRSSGSRSGLGWPERRDVRAAVEFARSRAPGARVVLIGSSMGSAASAFALGDDPGLADALVLDSSYSRLSNAIPGWWRFVGGQALAIVLWPVTPLAGPFAGFNPYKVDVAEALARVTCPVLLLHGDSDDLALPSEAVRNRDACNGDLVWLKDSGHTEGRWVHTELYMRVLVDFLRSRGLMESVEGRDVTEDIEGDRSG